MYTMSDTPLQAAAAAPGVDPNTMLASAPNTNTTQPRPTIAQEQAQFADEWSKDPSSNAPVRTWVDPAQRSTPDGQYLAAWYDQPAQPAAAPAFDANANAAAIGGMTAASAPAKDDGMAQIAKLQYGDMPVAPGSYADTLRKQAAAGLNDGTWEIRNGMAQPKVDPNAKPAEQQLGNDGPGGGPN